MDLKRVEFINYIIITGTILIISIWMFAGYNINRILYNIS